jgi:hypothetical protein
MAEYKDPIIAKLIEKLEAEGPVELKGRYYHGEVLLPSKEDLPMCSIGKDSLAVGQASNMEDDHIMPLIINILYEWTRDVNQSYDIVTGVNSLYEMVEGRNADYTLKANTIMYVLRKYQQLDTNAWLAVGPTEIVTANYGLGIERRGPNIFSVEAVIRLSARVHIARPGL